MPSLLNSTARASALLALIPICLEWSSVHPPQGAAGIPVAPEHALSLQAAEWATISDPVRLPLHNDAEGRLSFDFPASGSINYLYYSSPPSAIARSVSVEYRITTSGPVLFN